MSAAIRPEAEQDRAAIWSVNQAAFEGQAEANLVDALRDGGFVEVSLVADVDREIVGHILFSRVAIVTNVGTVDALSLAPMAVLPSHQRQGIGNRLVEAGVEACREAGHRIVVVLGHPEFYPRFGFSAGLARRLESPFGGGEAWMAMELVPGVLDGVDGDGTRARCAGRRGWPGRVFAAVHAVGVITHHGQPSAVSTALPSGHCTRVGLGKLLRL